jgi:hypothetical protein
MARVIQQEITIILSKLIKEGSDEEINIPADQVAAVGAVAEELFPDYVVEVDVLDNR